MEQRVEAEADLRRRRRQMPSTLVHTGVSMPQNMDQYDIDWASFQAQGFELPISLNSIFKLLHALADLVRNVAFYWSMTMVQIEASVHGTIQTLSSCIRTSC